MYFFPPLLSCITLDFLNSFLPYLFILCYSITLQYMRLFSGFSALGCYAKENKNKKKTTKQAHTMSDLTFCLRPRAAQNCLHFHYFGALQNRVEYPNLFQCLARVHLFSEGLFSCYSSIPFPTFPLQLCVIFNGTVSTDV